MVAYKDILAANAQIKDSKDVQIVVFFGATSGIGKATLKALVATQARSKIHLIGRKSAEEQSLAFIKEMSTINPNAEVIWTEADISLLAETKRVCDLIKSNEPRIDLLFHTAGYAPFGQRKETSEGIEIAQCLEYYTRILSTQLFLPLLNKSPSGRVASVLGGGLEKQIDTDDLDLRQPGNFSGVKAQGQYIAMNTLTLERLATSNPNVTFIHSWPGFVNTGNIRRSFAPNSAMGWLTWLIFEPILGLFSYSFAESGQRHLFQATSAAFGGRDTTWSSKPGVNSLNVEANGLFLVNHKCECTPNEKTLPTLREKAQDKVWNHTQDILRPYL